MIPSMLRAVANIKVNPMTGNEPNAIDSKTEISLTIIQMITTAAVNIIEKIQAVLLVRRRSNNQAIKRQAHTNVNV